jgi:peptide-methionine (S)-S-oxide reductase
MLLSRLKMHMVTPQRALRGRDGYAFTVPATHFVTGRAIQAPFPPGLATASFGLGCFWGAERSFWQTEGVWTTAVGYSGGYTPFPTYDEVCSTLTGHAEVVLAVYDPEIVSLAKLLTVFWEAHDPSQGMRQGNDVGTQYRSAIYLTDPAERELAQASKDAYSKRLIAANFGPATTEIAAAGPLYYAEGYHQQYLAKNLDGYCGHGGTGVSCPVEAQLSGSSGCSTLGGGSPSGRGTGDNGDLNSQTG